MGHPYRKRGETGTGGGGGGGGGARGGVGEGGARQESGRVWDSATLPWGRDRVRLGGKEGGVDRVSETARDPPILPPGRR